MWAQIPALPIRGTSGLPCRRIRLQQGRYSSPGRSPNASTRIGTAPYGRLDPELDDRFATQLTQICTQDYQLDAGESHPLIWCLAAPVVRDGQADEVLTVISTAAHWAQHRLAITAATTALARAAAEAHQPARPAPALTREAFTAAAVRSFGLPE